MQVRGPLMIEHRLIDRMIALFRRRLETGGPAAGIDPAFIEASLDFMRFYADRTHHGKEEDIYFAVLEGKALSPDERKIMKGLLADHVQGRTLVRALAEANGSVRLGDNAGAEDVRAILGKIVALYPGHIEKEDKVFFPAVQRYFSLPEEEEMLRRFREFDRQIVHEKYGALILKLEERGSGAS